MGKILTRFFIILFILPIVFVSCEDGCTDPYVAFTVGEINKTDGTYIKGDDTLTISSFSVLGIGQANDSLMLTGQSSGTIELLLNSASTETQLAFLFAVSYKETVTNDEGEETTQTVTELIPDIVTFNYENIPYFMDIECGCSVHHIINSVEFSNTIIKSVEIINPSVTNEKAINFTLTY